jgi:lipoprotein-anchoring transpeptidase ErfK/SrfK
MLWELVLATQTLCSPSHCVQVGVGKSSTPTPTGVFKMELAKTKANRKFIVLVSPGSNTVYTSELGIHVRPGLDKKLGYVSHGCIRLDDQEQVDWIWKQVASSTENTLIIK